MGADPGSRISSDCLKGRPEEGLKMAASQMVSHSQHVGEEAGQENSHTQLQRGLG
jgi:hypothetical protein